MSLPTRKVTMTINGKRHGPLDVPEGLMMIDVLHEMLGLTGSRLGCGIGICHACVVIWDRDDKTSEEVHDLLTGASSSTASASPSRASPRPMTRARSTLRLADPRNLIVATLDGIGPQNFPHRVSLPTMPGFADKLSDEQAAALVNYLRAAWGGQKPDVTAAAVRALR